MARITYLEMIASLLQDEKELVFFEESYQHSVKKSLKIVEHRISREEFLSLDEVGEWNFSRSGLNSFSGKGYDDLLYIEKEERGSFGSSFLHEAGFFYLQEMAAGVSAQVLEVKKGDIVLDMCASPGGKSVQLGDALLRAGSGFLVSNEPSEVRRKALIHNLNRCGIYSSLILGYDGRKIGSLLPETFDKVLVDAPCSGEGMQYKSDHVQHFWNLAEVLKLSRLQKELLLSGVSSCKIGGEIVYSTCTLNPLENEAVVAAVLQHCGERVELVDVEILEKSEGFFSWDGKEILSQEQAKKVARFWPHRQKTGGFFVAKFRKKDQISFPFGEKKERLSFSQLDLSDSLQKKVSRFLFDHWDIVLPGEAGFFFVQSHQMLYVTSTYYEHFHDKVFIEKTGIPIAKVARDGTRIPEHGLGALFGHFAKKSVVEISDQDAKRYTNHQDIELPSAHFQNSDFLMLLRKGKGFSVGKIVDGKLKNKFM